MEIVNDLKELTFYKSTNINAGDDTPNAIIILEEENEIVIDKVIIYGNSVAHIGDKNDYEIKHSDLDKLFKKYKID
ncbi:hypothetical protein [Clostridium saccharobutylicum]|uniref:Uncharacterized protein n=1 Tax=Clostridium saccharobutylicum DSM 13864 TaxID=1345695 RepID=U5MML5_CLOSA|nr:hypothetical protein [Clostridium saccharobutylicum]AGX41835.1 hypothetical protein CLSA_c08220 [Clostridium saccharobutylicum DSM 13864]AQR89110.1 hypothetical protein CLOSC_08060 [Clostridium saccharobutylicum]AQR99011.1 hypothetical protein CSACC_08130 [Clostridium saccharobutylicum]AQS12999.1 hypothetical protein CLOSACC_08130 [Clostridium saccharobutylicum]MBA8788755.1 hypothetical protein [Clostridium saccharobutylicum]